MQNAEPLYNPAMYHPVVQTLMLNEEPILIRRKIACLIGLSEAIVFQQLNYWLHRPNIQNAEHFHDGRFWVYNTYEEWQKQFPFWSVRHVRRIFTSLRKMGLVIVQRFNKQPYDKTNWYTINYKRLIALYEEDS